MPAGGREKMRYIVNSREMNLYDSRTIEEFHMPQAVLMERAALSFVETLRREKRNTSRTLVVCGSGNNGGDGYAIARMLMQAGNTVDVLEAPHTGKASVGNQLQKKIFLAYGGKILTEFPEGKSYTLVIDAVFGVGLSRSVEGEYASLIDRMNAMEGAKAAVDIASGISADNGNVLGTAFRADLTVTFAFEKVGCLLWPGNQYAGKVVVADIGITPDAFGERKPAVAALEDADLSLLAARESHSNKGTFGRLLVIAGSPGMSGAAYLCAKAAYASGCGLVRIFTPEENRAILQTQLPEAVITAYSSKKAEAPLLSEAMSWADTIVCGPGIGTTDAAAGMVRTVIKNAAVPVLLDADALNVIAKDTNLLLLPHTELVVTPHLGEMSRLTGDSVAYLQNHLIEAADEFARQYNVICVLKDEHTATAIPYSQTWLNVSGNAGLATAGSGDVLSGIIGGLMAQGIRVEQAAPLGVYLHGKAGEAAGARRSMRGMTASDIHDGMCEILAGLEQTQSQLGKDGIS